MDDSAPEQPLARRDFFKRAVTASLAGLAGLTPLVAGLVVLLDPLRGKSHGPGAMVRIAPLAALPQDGVPRQFAVSADHTDAWNKYCGVRVGAVYLRRTGPRTVEAFNASCPHAGGFIDYEEKGHCFNCPLHNSRFALDGSILTPRSPSPRGMDSLAVEIRDEEIWVRFENFQAGIRQKIAT